MIKLEDLVLELVGRLLTKAIMRRFDDYPGRSLAILVGGFSDEESITVAKILNDEKIDLLEISGGTYEQAKFLGYDKLAVKPKKNISLKKNTIATF